ncbi:RNA polymerase sigma factor SigJ [Polaromonas sp. LjRoot131]|uniref:RNA polymerase sigma factor SigJ n=1 Tax=Polaromonas sp. LjRoot131 TaxID=3342262 RepID=UPI003ECDBAAE
MDNPPSPSAENFDAHRPRLLGIAYRMLGSHADAQDVVQDAWLRWNSARPDDLRSAEAWLVTTVTRLSIDRLRAAKTAREHYTGFWLAEPMLTDTQDSPEQMLEFAGDISLAFLAVLERLTPDERAAFLLREVFDADYADMARTLGKSQAACRQLVSRAKAQVREGKTRFSVSREEHLRLLARFAAAAREGNLATLKSLISEEASLVSDGGGVVPSFGQVLRGAQRLAQLYFATALNHGPAQRLEIADINGVPGLLRFVHGRLESVQSLYFENGLLAEIHTQRNPAKLVRVLSQLEEAGRLKG